MLTPDGCRTRRQRFRQRLADRGLDAGVVTDRRDVYYLTGLAAPERLPAFLVVETAGDGWLVAPTGARAAGIGEVLDYEWNEQGTGHWDPLRRLEAVAARRLAGRRRVGRLGWQEEALPRLMAELVARTLAPAEWVAIDADLRALQRRKDSDEVAALHRSIAANIGAYEAARAAIRPGVTELEVLAAGWRGAVLAAGETVSHDGDYRCGAYNGPARDRPIEAGELYIIDAWTCCRGYWADMARVFLVGDEPTTLQQSVCDHVAGVQRRAAALLRPGLDTRELWRTMDTFLREHPALADTGLVHHGGHGIGLHIHEEPDINRDRGDRLVAGDVVCLEPGGYTRAARYGARIENMYLITDGGAENLCDYPPGLRRGGAG